MQISIARMAHHHLTDAEFEDGEFEFEEYATLQAGWNEIRPYWFKPTVSNTPAVERDDDSGAENISRL